MSTLSDDIQSAIKKNLPAEVAANLQAFITEAEFLRKENEQLKKFNKEYQDQNAGYVDENLRLATALKEHEELQKREAAVLARENTLAVTIAQEKQQAAEKRSEDIFRLAETVFRSPIAKRTVFENDQHRNDYLNGQQVYTKTGSSRTEEETTA